MSAQSAAEYPLGRSHIELQQLILQSGFYVAFTEELLRRAEAA
jgi:hypothetical protein